MLPKLHYQNITKAIIHLALTLLLLLNFTLIFTSVVLRISTLYLRLITVNQLTNVLSNQSERLIGLIATPAHAASSSYKLKFPNLNLTSGSQESDSFKTPDTSVSAGFYVKADFPYIKTIIPFSFTISNLNISLGHLTLSNFSSVTNTLTVSFGGGGYQVTTYENHPLQLNKTATNIPDTTCNAGCSETRAGTWNDPAKYGFGYNIAGNDIPAEFTGPALFKQFANASLAEAPQTVMSSPNAGKNRTATVTYKVNVGTSQAAGDYANSIIFTALPSY